MAQTSAYMARTNRFIKKTDAFMDRTEMKLQNHDATLESLETQVGQISQILSSRPIGGFPSDTEVAKGATHEQCNAIITRSGKILKNNQGGMAANSSPATDTPAKADEPAQASEDHRNPQPTMGESSAKSSHAQSGKPEEIRPPPSFPQRANPRGPRFNLDPEIERIQRQLKRRIRDLMDVYRNNGQQPAEGLELPARADEAIAPPAPQMNQQLPARTVRDYLAEDLEGLNPAVTMPDFEAEHFELKLVMFNMLNTLGQFGGTPNENARQHVKSFLEICKSFKIHGVSNDVLKLKLFPYSLRDKAKTWLNNLQPGSLQSWTQLCRCFLAKFSYTNMTDHLRNQITSFQQEDDEVMHEAWEQYRDLFRRCPMHGLPEWTQVSIFYNSFNTPTRMMLDASSNVTLLDMPPRESLEILDKLAQNDYQHPTARRGMQGDDLPS
ncbi:hypothetical protein GQ457_09G019820 [Hibiscus cannabinus]